MGNSLRCNHGPSADARARRLTMTKLIGYIFAVIGYAITIGGALWITAYLLWPAFMWLVWIVNNIGD